jgi:hypothetical protein
MNTNQPQPPTAARSAILLPAAAALLVALAPLLLPPLWRAAAASGRALLPPLRLLLAGWRAGVLAAFVWTCGAHVLEIVFTEPVAFGGGGGGDPTKGLLVALRHPDPLVQVRGGVVAVAVLN